MKVNISRAAELFFPNPSLEAVYIEAVANAIDAGATQVDISIKIEEFSKVDTLSVHISDNGTGFTDENFYKFSKLLESKKDDHKGIGRLVYMSYFTDVKVISCYGERKRTFVYNDDFEEKSDVESIGDSALSTVLEFTGYRKEKVKAYDYLKPTSIKNVLMFHFFPLFYDKMLKEETLIINIDLDVTTPNVDHAFFNSSSTIDVSKIPKLKDHTFQEPTFDMYADFTLYYSIKQVNAGDDDSLIVALNVDGRTQPIKLLETQNVPKGYDIIFLLYSDLFTGRVNENRSELNFSDTELIQIKRMFKQQIISIIKAELPQIEEENKKISTRLNEKYPHLQGYFEEEPIGIIDPSKSLEVAQSRFFQAQKKILEADHLTETQYQDALEISSRLLMEYVLYRNFTIDRLRKIDKNSPESDIHSIIVPQRVTLKQENVTDDIFTNNAWLLDDKYMSYATILSEARMDELIAEITLLEEEVEEDPKRPDIAIVFSADPDKSAAVDVVIVELKKLGLGLAKEEEVVSQLKQRARKLLDKYPNRIQRVWFYGITEVSVEFERSLLEQEYVQLYSTDRVFYKEESVIVNMETKAKVPIGVFVLSFEAFLKDVETRNDTFLKILKNSIAKHA
jgi:hypothetical protein